MSETVALWILGGLLGLVSSLFIYIWRATVRDIKVAKDTAESAKIDAAKAHSEALEIQLNYNQKFTDVHDKINNIQNGLMSQLVDVKDEIIKEVHRIQLHCASVHSQQISASHPGDTL